MAAGRVLRAIESSQLQLGEALSRARDVLPDRRDRHLTTELVVGTLRWRGAIDYQLQARLDRPLARLDAVVLDTLRLSAYQLLHLDRVPTRAVVYDAVEMVKTGGARSAAPLVNAVLRRLARDRASLTWPDPPASIDTPRDQHRLIEQLAVVHSHPAWLVQRWLGRYGPSVAEAWLRFNNQTPRLTLSPNRLVTDRDELQARLHHEGIEAALTTTASHGVLVTSDDALRSSAFLAGMCVVQDESAQIVMEIVQARAGTRVLDLCAAPGGKTLAMAAEVSPTGLVVAADVRPRRVRRLVETMKRCHARRVSVLQVPSHGLLPFRDGVFDRVLVDAPCSGLGTLRRDPDIRWRRQPEDLSGFADCQLELLQRAAPLVGAGGRLIYTTCSSEPDENEDVVDQFLRQSSAFHLLPIDQIPGLAPAVRALMTASGHLRTHPGVGLEAFFGAVLVRSPS
jgi:16S rRNA (cytosine967-C5)-methyltransferase